jgi:signal transduction histidine kinase
LLDVTKITKNKLVLSLKNVSIHKELAHTIELVKHDIDDKQLKIETEFSASNFVMEADPSRLQQVFWNIVKNAVKFTPKKGKISISTKNEFENQISVRIKDSGIGILTFFSTFLILRNRSPSTSQAFSIIPTRRFVYNTSVWG